MVTLERLRHPAGFITIAATGNDFAAASRIVEQDVKKQRLAAERRERSGAAVLLIW